MEKYLRQSINIKGISPAEIRCFGSDVQPAGLLLSNNLVADNLILPELVSDFAGGTND